MIKVNKRAAHSGTWWDHPPLSEDLISPLILCHINGALGVVNAIHCADREKLAVI